MVKIAFAHWYIIKEELKDLGKEKFKSVLFKYILTALNWSLVSGHSGCHKEAEHFILGLGCFRFQLNSHKLFICSFTNISLYFGGFRETLLVHPWSFFWWSFLSSFHSNFILLICVNFLSACGWLMMIFLTLFSTFTYFFYSRVLVMSSCEL